MLVARNRFRDTCLICYFRRQVYPQFRMAFKESTSCFSPNGFSSLQRLLKEESKGLGLRSALALVRLSQHDPDVFYKLKQARRLVFFFQVFFFALNI